MPIDLTTGVPGAGKTLFTVSEVLRPLVGTTISYSGRDIPRRLMIGGVPDLLLQHELVEVPVVQGDDYRDDWSSIDRRPGDAPHDVPVRADNWWLWCMPGDVIVIDECQRLFRPMPSGRKIPGFIAKLETHRHYGVDFVLVTQHPQLLHANVRNLVGRHRHVRRLFGRGAAMVYEWDHCTHPDKIKTATKRLWSYRKASFGLYKSAEVHTKHRSALGLPLIVLGVSLLALPYLGYKAYRAVIGDKLDAGKASVAALPASAPASAPALGTQRAAVDGARVVLSRFPMTEPEPVQDREPYFGRAFVLDGSYRQGGATWAVFGVLVDGQRVATVTLAQLVRSGYSWVDTGHCTGLLVHGQLQRQVSCSLPGSAPLAPVHAASVPSV